MSEYTDDDFENLSEEWENNDEELIPPDELPYGHPARLPLYVNISLCLSLLVCVLFIAFQFALSIFTCLIFLLT